MLGTFSLSISLKLLWGETWMQDDCLSQDLHLEECSLNWGNRVLVSSSWPRRSLEGTKGVDSDIITQVSSWASRRWVSSFSVWWNWQSIRWFWRRASRKYKAHTSWRGGNEVLKGIVLPHCDLRCSRHNYGHRVRDKIRLTGEWTKLPYVLWRKREWLLVNETLQAAV